jgi:DNA-nicking Smr family endonuclease
MSWPFWRRKKLAAGAGKRSIDEAEKRDVSADDSAPEPVIITDTLDLHGFFPQQIPPMIRDFIDNARELGLRRLRIVHGKGRSRLKWEVHQVLKDSPEVESFGDAPPESGGWGATMVLLKESRGTA